MIRTGSVIELAGSPGAGKTTLVPVVSDLLRSRGLLARTAVEVARDLSLRGPIGRLAGVLPSRLRRALLWRVHLVEAFALGWWIVGRRPGLFHVVRRQRSRPPEAMAAQRRVVTHFIRHLGTEELFRRRARANEVLIVDEGAVHRIIQLFVSQAEQPTRPELARYLASVPRSTAVVLVVADPTECVRRIRERGTWPRFAQSDPSEVERFVAHAAQSVNQAADLVRQSGWTVVEVENFGAAGVTSSDVANALAPVFAAHTWSFRPRRATPDLGTLRHRLVRRLQPVAIGRPEAAQVLGSVGLDVVGSVHSMAGGRRSAIVSAETDEGRMVVKRYRSHWPEESVHHEHEIVRRLAHLSHPTVRLVPTPADETVVSVGAARYAVYRHVDGRSYAGIRLTPSDRRLLLGDLGTLLASLRAELRDHVPTHQHHLGLDARTGLALRDLEWYLERLATLRAAAPLQLGADGRWLAERSFEIEKRLIALDGRLRDADLPRTIIHGDFGEHNVLFTRDGPVLHDFELARHEWRLTELAMVFARLDDQSDRRVFIDAYRDVLELEEWSCFDDVSEWNSLTGSVYAWEMFLTRDDKSRLRVARTRAERALSHMADPV